MAPRLPQIRSFDSNQFLQAGVAGEQFRQNQRRQNTLSQAGQLAAQGDLQGARDAAFKGGQLDIANQFGSMIKQSNDQQLAKTQRLNQVIGKAVMSAKTPEQYAQLVNMMEGAGHTLTPEEKDFNNRDFLINRAMSFDQMMTQEFRNRQLALQERKLTASQGKATTKEQAKVSELQRGGQQVLSAVDQLEGKVGFPGSPQESLFEEATGPLADSTVGRAFKTVVPGQSQDLTLLRSIKQDAQAINTLMQRALLKGGGSITENERAQINEILGGISNAQNADQARALLQNFRQLVGSIFQLNAPEEQTRASDDLSGLPEGAQQIGTSGGKPVFQTPDGRTFIQD